MTYAPLHNHSEYSLLDGLSHAKAMAKHAKKLGLPAIALTDHGTMAGTVEFYEACKAEGVKPIIGFEAYVAPGRRQDKPAEGEVDYYHLILLAKDQVGYQNLMALMTEGFRTGFYRKPRIDRQLLLQHRQGLIVLSGCLGGEIAQHLLKDNLPAARLTAAWYKQTFGGDYYLEIQDHGQEDDKAYLGRVVQLAEQLDIELVATPDSHYLEADDAEAAQILHCIVTHSTLSEPKFVLSPYGQYAIKPPEEMEALFPEDRYPRAISNTLAIAEKCDLELVLDERAIFPSTSHVTGEKTPMDWLRSKCQWHLDGKHLGYAPKIYQERLEYELSIIEQTGFAEYIVLVYDFVKWARDRGIPAVPRGSAAGSLLLYLLGVSDIDPIEYGLTFERFLNPERIQMPDVDMDFADERRSEVFEYLVGRYGADRVSQIVTFGQMRAKAAVKDTARVLGWAPSDANELTKLIPEIPVHMTLDDCLATVVEFKALYDKDPGVKKLVDLARRVEGTARSLSVHAAGVVICGEPLTAHTPLQPARKDDVNIVTQYGQKSLEKLGLLKMDVLGLANLTMIERCLALIEQHRGIKLDVRTIPDRDPKTFSMLCRGETATCFQLEGGGMTRYVKELQPEHVRHLAVMVALYRPGPMQLIPSFIARRHGREEVRYLDPDLEPILGETYGVLVYQDQVLRILETIAGYTKGQADIVRRAMGKKEPELMAAEKEKFLAGAREKGYGGIAGQLWDEIEPHAGYSFNKAHATCYGMVAYQTAYLKAHYPFEWTAAVLQTKSFRPEDLPALIAEARTRNVPLLRPDINRSEVRFSAERLDPGYHGGLGLRYGLGSVKSVGEQTAQLIVDERTRGGPFASLSDLLARANTSKVSSDILEALTKGGALDAFGPRESLLATIPDALKAVRKWKARVTLLTNRGQSTDDLLAPEIVLYETLSPDPAQYLDWELEGLGLFLSDHPFAKAHGRVTTEHTVESLKGLVGQRVESVAGAVTGVKELMTKAKKERMAIVTLADLTGEIDVVVFPRQYKETLGLWQPGRVLALSGEVDVREERLQLKAEAAVEVEIH